MAVSRLYTATALGLTAKPDDTDSLSGATAGPATGGISGGGKSDEKPPVKESVRALMMERRQQIAQRVQSVSQE